MKTVGLFIQTHGSYCTYSNTNHITIENDKLIFVSDKKEGTLPVAFQLDDNCFVYDTSFPGYSTSQSEEDALFVEQTLNGKQGKHHSFVDYIAETERIILSKPSMLWHYGQRFLYVPGDSCPNRCLTIDSDMQEIHVKIHYHDEDSSKREHSITTIYIINLLNTFGWSNDYESQHILKGTVPVGKTRSSGVYDKSDIVIPLSVLITCVKKVFSLKNATYVCYIDNCSPFHNDMKELDYTRLSHCFKTGIMNYFSFVKPILERTGAKTCSLEKHKENKIIPEKYEEGFKSAYMVLRWNYNLWDAIEKHYDGKDALLFRMATTRKTAIYRAYKKWHFKTQLKSSNDEDSQTNKKLNKHGISWFASHILWISEDTTVG